MQMCAWEDQNLICEKIFSENFSFLGVFEFLYN